VVRLDHRLVLAEMRHRQSALVLHLLTDCVQLFGVGDRALLKGLVVDLLLFEGQTFDGVSALAAQG
jgi:hypothetical protein